MIRHPVHPIFVHFPIACWILATGIDVVGMLGSLNDSLGGVSGSDISYLLLCGGSLFSVPTVIAGIVDYVRLPEPVQTSSRITAHIGAMIVAMLLFVAATLIRFGAGGFETPVAWYGVTLEVTGSLCLVAGGYFASLVVFYDLQQSSIVQQATKKH